MVRSSLAGGHYCLCIADLDDVQHAAAIADALIVAPPIDVFDPAALDQLLTDLSQAWRDQLITWFDARRIPRDWITADSQVRDLLRYVIRHYLMTNDGFWNGDYPNVDLAQQVNTLPAFVRQKINTWAQGQGYDVSDIPPTATVGQLLRELVRRRPGFAARHVLTGLNADGTNVIAEI